MATYQTLASYSTHADITMLKNKVESQIHIPSESLVGTEIFNRITNMKHEALITLGQVLATDEKNYEKISKSHSVLLTQLATGDMGEVFSGTGVNIIANRLLSEDNGLVAVMQPYPMKYPAISSMSTMALLKSIENMMALVGTSGRANKRRLAIMIDEAGEAMYKDIYSMFNKAGGLGVTMFVYSQSYEDYVMKLDSSTAKVINDNINTSIIMRMNDLDSKKIAAESLGTITEHKSMFMANSDGGSRFSVGNEDVPVANPEDIGELDVAMGYLRHNGEVYLVDFPFVEGVKNNLIEMPVLENERIRREMSAYENQISIID